MSDREKAIREIEKCRQRIYQLRHGKLGLCSSCSRPVVERWIVSEGKPKLKIKLGYCWIHYAKYSYTAGRHLDESSR